MTSLQADAVGIELAMECGLLFTFKCVNPLFFQMYKCACQADNFTNSFDRPDAKITNTEASFGQLFYRQLNFVVSAIFARTPEFIDSVASKAASISG